MNCENYCNNHKCSKCGSCCAMGIPITRKEEKTIKKYIEERNIRPENLIDDNNFYVMCCFYDRKNKCCKIYPVRPEICRSFKCDRDNSILEKEKIDNHKRSYWNHIAKDGVIKHFTTFDMLFYNDPVPMLNYLFRYAFNEKNDDKKFEKIKRFLISQNYEELVNSLEPVYEKNV